MKPEHEALLGLALWGIGVGVLAGVALATPRFFTEGLWLGTLFGALGMVLMIVGCVDMFCDDWEDEIKKGYETKEKKDER